MKRSAPESQVTEELSLNTDLDNNYCSKENLKTVVYQKKEKKYLTGSHPELYSELPAKSQDNVMGSDAGEERNVVSTEESEDSQLIKTWILTGATD